MFIALLMIAAAALASAAGFFSIYGLAHIYTASALSIIIMGVSMEYGKLIAASALYRLWDRLIWPLRMAMLVSIAVLMMITSIGVFGYLTSSYQQDSAPTTEISQKLSSDQSELTRLTDRKSQIDSQIAKLPDNYVNGRKHLMDSFQPEYGQLEPKIDKLTADIASLQSSQTTNDVKVGPIMYVAKVLNQDPDKIIFWLTIAIVLVFDPLAMILTLCTNIAIAARKETVAIIEPELIADPIVNVPANHVSTRDTLMERMREDISSQASLTS